MTRPLRVVTLPPAVKGSEAHHFALEARRRGARVLEVRTDLHSADAVDAAALASALDLLASEREAPIPVAWREAARLVDVPLEKPLGAPGAALLVSHHAEHPLPTEQAL